MMMMTTAGSGRLRLATRGSALARAQAGMVAAALSQAWDGLTVELTIVSTTGDRLGQIPVTEIGGKGIFTGDVQDAVLGGVAEVAVHSAKDLPAEQTAGLVLGAVPRREAPGDVLVARVGTTAVGAVSLDALPDGARVGTASPRRAALLAELRPGLQVVSLRGNVDTRVELVRRGELDGVVLAQAGLSRLGYRPLVTPALDAHVFTPAPGQGCLALEVREGDEQTLAWLSAVDHAPSRRALIAERAFLARLGGSCTLPAGALAHEDDAEREDEREMVMTGMLARDGAWWDQGGNANRGSVSGLVRAQVRGRADEGAKLGSALADELRAQLSVGAQ